MHLVFFLAPAVGEDSSAPTSVDGVQHTADHRFVRHADQAVRWPGPSHSPRQGQGAGQALLWPIGGRAEARLLGDLNLISAKSTLAWCIRGVHCVLRVTFVL